MTRSTVIPGMTYRDCPAAIEWLCKVFGFEKHAVYPAQDGSIMHAELTLGGGMVMLGSLNDGEYRKYNKHPDEVGGVETHSISVIVDDADVVYERAKAAGAPMIFDIETKPYGGRGFTCRDLEGRIWNVGTYNPWAGK